MVAKIAEDKRDVHLLTILAPSLFHTLFQMKLLIHFLIYKEFIIVYYFHLKVVIESPLWWSSSKKDNFNNSNVNCMRKSVVSCMRTARKQWGVKTPSFLLQWWWTDWQMKSGWSVFGHTTLRSVVGAGGRKSGEEINKGRIYVCEWEGDGCSNDAARIRGSECGWLWIPGVDHLKQVMVKQRVSGWFVTEG